jgi:hypothetical protein
MFLKLFSDPDLSELKCKADLLLLLLLFCFFVVLNENEMAKLGGKCHLKLFIATKSTVSFLGVFST